MKIKFTNTTNNYTKAAARANYLNVHMSERATGTGTATLFPIGTDNL